MIGYKQANLELWSGRIDSKTDVRSFRWHQIITILDLNQPILSKALTNLSFVLIGYQVDAGIVLNSGRAGASYGPDAVRNFLSNKPCSFSSNVKIYDGGNIEYIDSVETAQKTLKLLVYKCLNAGYFPIVIGGGHDVAFGTMQGLIEHLDLEHRDLGIINFDAHFDLRPYSHSTSGTMFRQVYDLLKKKDATFNHMTIGIQKSANTLSLFDYSQQIGSKYILAANLNTENQKINEYLMNDFLKNIDDVYLTICTDVFASPFAPGVSSPQPMGIYPDNFIVLFKQILSSKKVRAFDIAEISPSLDNSNATASLGALIIYTIINHLAEMEDQNAK